MVVLGVIFIRVALPVLLLLLLLKNAFVASPIEVGRGWRIGSLKGG